jgi:hypothetical protein
MPRSAVLGLVRPQARGRFHAQRASAGGLLITEGTVPALRGGGLAHMPGIWSDAQIAAWTKVRMPLFPSAASALADAWLPAGDRGGAREGQVR